ncbi:ABC transporter substrate-binding protein [Mesorhizobium sp. 2RAF21]|uniref:ABC transporter substrate-binding protein n=1 Tax=Mesorhizobium sp. 2RAF21 TaxID=3232995 RepID=UPI003F9E2FA0
MLGAITAAALLAASAGAAVAEEPVRFGAVGGLSSSSAGLALAVEEGKLKAAGIEHEITEFKGGGPAVQALVGGAVDICVCAPEHVVRLRNRGVDAVNLAPLSNRLTYAIFGPVGSTDKGLESLKGKKVGITSPGSKTDTIIRLALKRAEIEADAEVEIVAIGGTASQITALKTGNIAAGFISGIDALSAEADGYPIVFDWRDQSVPDLALIVTEQWIKDHPETARKIAAITHEEAVRISADRALRGKTLKWLYPHVTDAVIETATDRLNSDTVTTTTFDEASFDRLQKDLIEVDPALKPISYDQFSRDFTK